MIYLFFFIILNTTPNLAEGETIEKQPTFLDKILEFFQIAQSFSLSPTLNGKEKINNLISAISINEVELNPVGNDSGNEWIELYSENVFDLGGYYLENNRGEIQELEGIFSGYFVVIFSSQWLENSDEKIYLKKENITEDETPLLGDVADNYLSWNNCPRRWEFNPSTQEEENICSGGGGGGGGGERGKARIINLDTIVDGKRHENISHEEIILPKVGPGSELEFELEIKNIFTEEENISIYNITVEVKIKNIGNGDDMIEKSTAFNLDAQESKKDINLEFEIPVSVRNGRYEVEIRVTGQEENGKKHYDFQEVYIDAESLILINSCQILDIEGATYVLQNDIITSGNCFEILADNIILDLNKKSISGEGNGSAIYLTGSHSIIKDGKIQNFNKGVEISNSSKNTFTGNSILENRVGIYFGSTVNSNLIYNNYFSNEEDVEFEFERNQNSWNVEMKKEPNIIEGQFIGGNFWAKSDGTGFSQTCADSDGDGFCDEFYELEENNTDFLPLVDLKRLTTDVAAKSIKLSPRHPELGKLIKTKMKIQNLGAVATDLNVSYGLNGPGYGGGNIPYTIRLEPMEIKFIYENFSTSRSGHHLIWVKVTPETYDPNLDNNQLSKEFYV